MDEFDNYIDRVAGISGKNGAEIASSGIPPCSTSVSVYEKEECDDARVKNDDNSY